MIKMMPRQHIQSIAVGVLALLMLALNTTLAQAQQIPPLPDNVMEISGLGYRINGRYTMVWLPSQGNFRDQFSIDPKAILAYREYVPKAYLSKSVRWISVGAMASLFFVDHTRLSAGFSIAAGAIGGVVSVPLSAAKRAKLEEAVLIRNKAWYKKVRE